LKDEEMDPDLRENWFLWNNEDERGTMKSIEEEHFIEDNRKLF